MTLPVPFEHVREELRDRDAAAFVHVGREDDPTLRYLGRAGRVDGELAVVVTAESAMLLAADAPAAARESFPGDSVLPAGGEIPTGERVAAVLDDLGLSGTVLTPRTVPHDAALYLEQSGYEVASTAVVEDARVAKTDAERLRQSTVQSAACAGMRRAAAVLDATHVHEGRLDWEDAPLTALRLRREVDAAVAAEGMLSGYTAIGVDGEPATPRSETTIEPGQTVVVDLAPQGPDGYHGRLVRTFVVDGDGGWTRRAQLAAEGALDAAIPQLSPDGGDSVVTELDAEVTAYGFEPSPDSGGYGVGLERHERPTLDATDELPVGAVLALDVRVSDPAEGTVRLADLVAVTEDGGELLGAFPRSLSP
ncbi:M24 family metallopeptidase [Haloarchaeobius salinus]|uniref:M24 family metallopeptidase n=1 Tax=Haloarchaeobius salinus TaxID=1198298 RepID=UPI00210CCB4C|nr:M24 family metallopeptidase [Haloarchaeobius salinus]